MKLKIDDLFAIHNLDFSRNRRHAHDPLSKKQKNNAPPVIHPVVRTHPNTSRKSLFLGDHAEYIKDMDYSKGRNFIERLNKLAIKTKFIYKHQYKEGDVLVWDNRRLLHKGTKYDTANVKRVMRRTTIIGEAPK
jgi:alpha-ketoglutarate-dependent taurine dioxygenase